MVNCLICPSVATHIVGPSVDTDFIRALVATEFIAAAMGTGLVGTFADTNFISTSTATDFISTFAGANFISAFTHTNFISTFADTNFIGTSTATQLCQSKQQAATSSYLIGSPPVTHLVRKAMECHRQSPGPASCTASHCPHRRSRHQRRGKTPFRTNPSPATH